MQIKNSDLKDLLFRIASKYVSEEEAKYFSEEIFEAYVRKYPRSNVLKDEVITDTARQEKYKDNEFAIEKDLPSLIKLNCNHLPITFKLKWIHDLLVDRADKNGIAMVSMYNSGGMHSLHTWSQGLAKRGYFVLGSYNGGPESVVPLNGTQGIFGTNPLTYGFPTNEGTVVIDMATSEIPYFEIRRAKKDGIALKENTAVDQDGALTTDAAKALAETGISNLLPMGGGYKGYAINYLLEVMTGSLIGAKLSSQQGPGYVNEDHGGFLIVVNIEAFIQLEKFKNDVSEFNGIVRSQKPAEGKNIIIPGDNNLERLATVLKDGFTEVDEEVFNSLKGLA